MELHYSVLIDTEQARRSTTELEKLFKKLETSTDGEVRKLGELGTRFVKEMESGTHSTKETAIALASLERKITELGTSTNKIGFRERRNLRATAEEVRNVQKQVRQLEVARTQSHNKNMRQMREEQAEQRKTSKLERYAMKTTGRALGGRLGGGFVGATGGAGLLAVGAFSMLGDSLKDIFGDTIKQIKGTFGDLKFYLERWIKSIPFFKDMGANATEAEENLYYNKVGEVREEHDKAVGNLETLLNKTAHGTKEFADALRELSKAVPAFKNMNPNDIVHGNEADLKKIIDDYFTKQYRSAAESFASVSMYGKDDKFTELWDNITDLSKEIERKKEEIKRIEGAPLAIARGYQLNKANKELTEMQGRLNVLMGHYYNTLEPLQKKTEERIKQENELSHALADEAEASKRAKEASDKRAKIVDSLNKMAEDKGENATTYKEGLAYIEKMREKELQAIEKLASGYENDTEIMRLAEEAKNHTNEKADRMVRELSEEVGEMWKEIEENVNDLTMSAQEKVINEIRKKYAQKSKEFQKLYKDDPVNLIKAENLIKQAQAIEIENRKLEDNIKLIKEEADARVEAVESSEEYTNDIQREIDLLQAKKNEHLAIIKAIREQNHISGDELDMMAQAIAGYAKLHVQQQKAIENLKKFRKEAILSYAEYYGGELAGMDNAYLSALGKITQSTAGAMQSSADYKKAIEKGNKKKAQQIKSQQIGSAVQATIQFGLDTWNAFSESAKQGRQALDEWNAKVADSAHQLAMLTLEEFEYKQKNMYGVDDPYNRLTAVMAKDKQAETEAYKALSDLANNGMVQVGTKKKVQGKGVAQLVASGAGAGAMIGTAVGGYGAIVGGAIGAVSGLVTGLFASRERVAVYDNLRNRYGEIYDKDTLEINKQILADYDKMDDKTKKLVDNAKELLEVQKEARQEYEDLITDLTGELGDGVKDILYEAFTNKDIHTAIDGIRDYLGDAIAQATHKIAFGAVFGDMFESFDKQLKSTYDPETGQRVGDITEFMAGFTSQIYEKVGDYMEIMNEAEKHFKEMGYKNIFAGDETGQQALQGTIAGMSEDTAGKINGNFMGLKLTAMEISDKVGGIVSQFDNIASISRQSFNELQAINENTAQNKELVSDVRQMLRRWDSDGLSVR